MSDGVAPTEEAAWPHVVAALLITALVFATCLGGVYAFIRVVRIAWGCQC